MPSKTYHISRFLLEENAKTYCDTWVPQDDSKPRGSVGPNDDVCAICRSRVPRTTDS